MNFYRKLRPSIAGVFAAFVLISVFSEAEAEPLTVAIAANMKYVFDDISKEFKNETGIEIQSVLNASGKISTQIRNGAPFDLFMSADMEFPENLYKDGFALNPPKVYVYGLLVLWTEKNVDLSKGVAGLADASVIKVAIANPKVAPYGREALKSLDYFKVREAVEPKLVFGESITQVSQYVDTKDADVGFSAKSIVMAPELAGKGKWVDVPTESYEPIAQGIVILKHGSEFNSESARKFYDFIFSEKAREIFSRYGYKLP